MTLYTINVLNQSGVTRDYVVFPALPIVTSVGGPVTVVSNAWVAFNDVAADSSETLDVTREVHAFWSVAPASDLTPGVVIMAGGVAETAATQASQLPFVAAPAPGFGPMTIKEGAAGAFEIVTGADFSAASGLVFGLARSVTGHKPVPAATFLAQPNDRFEVLPASALFVANGVCTPGEVIDAEMLSPLIASVDFAGLPQTTATVIQDSNGAFTVAYN